MLELNGLSKSYGTTLALDNVSVKFKKGYVTSIYGPNGAGKSTLVKIICGEEKADEGKILYQGVNTEFKNYSQALKAGISYVPQDFGLLKNLTGFENIGIIKNLINSKILYYEAEVRKLINSIRHNLPLPKLTTKVESMSAYDQQLLAIYKALLFESEIIIFDESTTSINKEDFNKLNKVIQNLKEYGKAIIFISHRLDEVMNISDEVIILKDGKLIKKHPISEVSKDEIIRHFISEGVPTINKNGPEISSDPLCGFKIWNELIEATHISVAKGEIVALDTGDTSINQDIGYSVYEQLSKKYNLKVGIIPALRDDDAIFENLSIKDNLTLNVLQRDKYKSKTELSHAIDNVASQLKLKYQSWDQNINELSGGNKQKVIFGRWILADFDLLILIEPTAGIDLETKDIIHKSILI